MKFLSNPYGSPWYIRLAGLAVGIGVTLCLLYAGLAGMNFMNLVARVSGQIAASSAAAPPPPEKARLTPQVSSDPGVVAIQVVPPVVPAAVPKAHVVPKEKPGP